MSYLNYANAMPSGIPKTLINMVQNMQNWAAKITIGKTKTRNNSITEIRRSLQWLAIKERIRFQDFNTNLQMPKQPNLPNNLQELIMGKKIKHPGLHSSKTKFQLEVSSNKSCTFADKSFSVYGLKLWNTLPNSIKESTRTDNI